MERDDLDWDCDNFITVAENKQEAIDNIMKECLEQYDYIVKANSNVLYATELSVVDGYKINLTKVEEAIPAQDDEELAILFS